MSLYDLAPDEPTEDQAAEPTAVVDPRLMARIALGQVEPVAEPAPQFPQIEPDFLDRLALAFQALPQYNVREPWGAAIQGFTQGFGAARGGQFQRSAREREMENARLRESASNLANQRWQNARLQAQSNAALRTSLAAEKRAQLEAKRYARTTTETERHNRAMERLTGERQGTQGTEGDAAVADYGDLLINGQMDWPQVPRSIRNKVVEYVRNSGQQLLPRKARDTIQTLQAAKAALSGLQGQLDAIPAAPGPLRGPRGLVSTIEGALQTPGTGEDVAVYNAGRGGLLATLSRSTGERGVLTDQDVARARRLVPSIWDVPKVRADKWAQFNRFLDEIMARTVRTYTKSAKELTGEGAPDVSRETSVRMVAPDGRRLSVPSDKVAEMEALGARRAE